MGAIIIAANNILLPGGDVASAIVQKGGHQTNEESRRIMADRSWRPLNVGDAVHTKSGNLSCQYIIHAICPTWSSRYQSLCISLLEQACMESFRLAAHQLGLCSITLSAIGTDKVFGIPQEISAQVMYDALEEFSSSTEAKFSTLREVRIVIIDEETMSVFREEFIRRYVLQQTLPATNVTYQGFPPKENTENFQGGNLRKGSCKRGIKGNYGKIVTYFY